ncbi:MAG: chromate transporter [Lachnospiraceae bacterium]|nr:chromate transporter [Lachnospiraceae bacterium]MBQ9927991.1 chromate transporter [Lachnospiraceae bacterium]
MKELMELYWAFFRIGGLTFGGGLTMLPMLKYELVQKRDWISEEQLLDCYAIGQCTPGIIAINTATFVGYLRKGVVGGISATLGMMSPSVMIITVIALCLENFMDNVWLQHALMGVRGVVCALMLNTVITLAKKSLVSPVTYLICGVAFLAAMFTDIPLIVIVLAAGFLGVLKEKGRGEQANG